MLQQLENVAIQIALGLSPLLVAGIGWLLVRLTAWINSKTKNAWVVGVTARLDDYALTAVKTVQQLAVADLKVSNGGALTADQKMNAKADAIALVKAFWGPAGIDAAVKILGIDPAGIDALIASKVEAAVHTVATPPVAVVVAPTAQPSA